MKNGVPSQNVKLLIATARECLEQLPLPKRAQVFNAIAEIYEIPGKESKTDSAAIKECRDQCAQARHAAFLLTEAEEAQLKLFSLFSDETATQENR